MEETELAFKQIIVVCTNSRAPGERLSCAGAGRSGEEILRKLKAFIKQKKLEKVARAMKSGCQEHCETGPSAILLPQNLQLTRLDISDADQLIEKYLKPLVK